MMSKAGTAVDFGVGLGLPPGMGRKTRLCLIIAPDLAMSVRHQQPQNYLQQANIPLLSA